MNIVVSTPYTERYRVPYVIHGVGTHGKVPLGLPYHGYSPPVRANSEFQAHEIWRSTLKDYGLAFSIKSNSIVLE